MSVHCSQGGQDSQALRKMRMLTSSFAFWSAWCYVTLLACMPCNAFPCYISFSKTVYPNCQQLSSVYSLHWRVKSGVIEFGVSLSAPAAWVGLGISEAGGMKGADILVVHQAEGGGWAVSDMFSAAYAKPATDPQQDAALTAITKSATSLVAVIQRPLVTCDPNDLPILTNGLQQPVIWAYGNDTKLAYHGPSSRGNALVAFAPDPTAAVAADPPGVSELEVFMPAYQVPQDATTTYTCTVVKVPTGPKKQLIRYQSTVSSKQVHHMIMYGCTTAPAAQEGATFACAGMPADCQTFVLGWVPGMHDVVMPDDAGFPIGGTGIQWLALQVHYNNPLHVPLTDSSGFKLVYTEQLRLHDVGVLTLGQPQLEIPAGSPSYKALSNICPASCTSQFPTNLTVLYTAPHMHNIGKALTTQRLRGGVELSPLSQRRHWDFNFQQLIVPDPEDNIIMPGDQLITTCAYDSSDRTAVTTWGEDSASEMCYNFVAYYPAVPNIDICISGNSLNYATCTTTSVLAKVDTKDVNSLLAMVAAGKFVPTDTPQYTPYNASCRRSAVAPLDLGTTAGSSPAAASPATSAGKSPKPASSASSSAPASASSSGGGAPRAALCRVSGLTTVLLVLLLPAV